MHVLLTTTAISVMVALSGPAAAESNKVYKIPMAGSETHSNDDGAYVIGATDGQFNPDPAHPGNQHTHCAPEDAVWFSAKIAGRNKVVSICEHEPEDDSPNQLSYRYGALGDIELQYPASEPSFKEFTLRVYTRARTTYLKFDFGKDGYEYAILEGDDDGDYGAWLRVRKTSDDTILAEHKLDVESKPFHLMLLGDRVRQEPFDE